MMDKYITDERTRLKYELVGDYYLIAGNDEPEEDQPIGVYIIILSKSNTAHPYYFMRKH